MKEFVSIIIPTFREWHFLKICVEALNKQSYKKENFEEVDGKELLQTIMQLPITKWNYKGQASAPHIGPMAQDFYKLFKVGDNDISISSIDPSGIALRAIQELVKENKELKQQVDDLRNKTVDAATLQQLQQQLMQLQEQVKLLSLNKQKKKKGGDESNENSN